MRHHCAVLGVALLACTPGSIAGPQGAVGPQGPAGSAGQAGPAGPAGGIQVIDGHGAAIGPAVGVNADGFSGQLIVWKNGMLWEIAPDGSYLSAAGELYFISKDCTGTPYSSVLVPQLAMGYLPKPAAGDPMYIIDTGATAAQRTFGSNTDGAGGCYPNGPVTVAIPAKQVGTWPAREAGPISLK